MKINLKFPVATAEKALNSKMKDMPAVFNEKLCSLPLKDEITGQLKSTYHGDDVMIIFPRNTIEQALEAAETADRYYIDIIYQPPTPADWKKHGFVPVGHKMIFNPNKNGDSPH